MDKESLLRCLNDHRVDYVVIGATAFPIHGYARATLDIDIFIRPDLANAQRTRDALETFGDHVSDISVEDLLTYKILIRQYVVELDVHPFVKGVDFESVWRRRVPGRFLDVDVSYASLDDLIAMKRAAGRPKDIEDLRVLERLRRRRNDGLPPSSDAS